MRCSSLIFVGTLILSLLFPVLSYGQNPADAFHNAIVALDDDLGYELQQPECLEPEATGLCRVAAATNWINMKIYRLQELEKEIPDPLDDTAILRIRQAQLKNRNETEPGSQTYYRLMVEEWTCRSPEQAMELEKVMKTWKGRFWGTLDKTPVTWWREGKRIYFLRLGGWFVLGQEDAIRKSMAPFIR